MKPTPDQWQFLYEKYQADLLEQSQRITALEAENAALREIARAWLRHSQHTPASLNEQGRAICGGCGTTYVQWAGVHTADCPVVRFRALLGDELDFKAHMRDVPTSVALEIDDNGDSDK